VTSPGIPISRSVRPSTSPRATRIAGSRVRAAGLGHGEQGVGGRQQVRQRPGQARHQGLQREGWQEGRGRFGVPDPGGTLRLGEEGRRDPQAEPRGQGPAIVRPFDRGAVSPRDRVKAFASTREPWGFRPGWTVLVSHRFDRSPPGTSEKPIYRLAKEFQEGPSGR
jgi:hypothetical protein